MFLPIVTRHFGARVIGPFTVALNSTPVCDDGKPFDISAATDAADPTFKWFRNTGAGFVSLTETTPTISPVRKWNL